MLVTSAVMETELARNACRSRKLALWRRGVDIDIFNPSFRNAAMRERLSGGHPDAPLLVHVGRLGAEKNITVLKGAPARRLAWVALLTNACGRRRAAGEPGRASGAGGRWAEP